MEGGAGSGSGAALAELSSNADPVPPTSEAPARVAAPLRNSRLSTKLFRVGTGTFSLGMIILPFSSSPGFSLRVLVPASTKCRKLKPALLNPK
jgi:hypothetical protein